MVQKDLLLEALREQLKDADTLETKVALNYLIGRVLQGDLDIKVW
jgi:hypothetical protein